jgi:hypothetical protein
MKHPSIRRTLRLAAAVAAACAASPALAAGSTWTVDDDRAQCPSAGFTSIQAAVNQAAPWDTVVVCDGLYLESSTPINHPTQSPSQSGSMNGLTITKPLTIKGTGASRVTIRPAASLGSTLAGSAPFLRDGGGNVVTISRQSLGATDSNENFVDISGVTIDSPSAYAEAAVAFFNTSGRISRSTIGPLLRAADASALAAAPHGWGVIMTNSMQGAEAGVRREVTVADSLVTGYQSGGVLFDAARGADGAATTLQRSGIVMYGSVTGTRVVGSGANTVIPQTGVRFHAGARGLVSGAELANNRFSPDLRQSAGLLLTDAETGVDPQNAAQRAFSAVGTSFTGNGYGAFNANAANDAIREGAPAVVGGTEPAQQSWFGCAAGPLVGSPSSFAAPTNGCQGVSGADGAGNPSVELGTPRTTARPALAVPAATPDARPSGRFLTGDFTVAPGETIAPAVAASDDFGVKRVTVLLDGTSIASKSAAPYELTPTWTPGPEDAGRTFVLEARITDSAGQTSVSAPTSVTVTGAAFVPLGADAGSWDAGPVVVGTSASRTLTLTNRSSRALRLTSLEVSGAAFALAGGTCAADGALGAGEACTAVVSFAPAALGAASGALTVSSTASGDPVAVALRGTGVPAPAAPAPGPGAGTGTGGPPPEAGGPLAPPPAAGPKGRTIGPVTATLLRRAALTRGGALRIGSFVCARGCTVRLTGTLRADGRRFGLRRTRTLQPGVTTPATLRLTDAALTALSGPAAGGSSCASAPGRSSRTLRLPVAG